MADHRCNNIRRPTKGELFAWELEKDGREVNVRVDGPLVLNDMTLMIAAAVEALGLAYAMEDHLDAPIGSGKLVRLLDEWNSVFSGYHLHYPERRQLPASFRLLVDRLCDRDVPR